MVMGVMMHNQHPDKRWLHLLYTQWPEEQPLTLLINPSHNVEDVYVHSTHSLQCSMFLVTQGEEERTKRQTSPESPKSFITMQVPRMSSVWGNNHANEKYIITIILELLF